MSQRQLLAGRMQTGHGLTGNIAAPPLSAFNYMDPDQRLQSAASTPAIARSPALLPHRPNLRFAFDVGFVSRQFGQQRQYVLTTSTLNDFH
jgi:hypothetical protein